MTDEIRKVPRDIFVALVGSKPLVVRVDNWLPGTFEDLMDGDELLVYDGDTLVTVVTDGP